MNILVTGAAGFIGYHLTKVLLNRGDNVVGIDNINDYYDVNLKLGRLRQLGIKDSEIAEGNITNGDLYKNFSFIKCSLEDKEKLDFIFKEYKIDKICNLAAQAGVRYSLINPDAYIQSNIVGYVNLLEMARNYNVKHFVYASSSSVYGLNEKTPFSTLDNVDHPISLYAASKKSNELMAHTYSHLFNIPTTGLRFFTVYGPWGRPDMALFLFTKAIIDGDDIKVFNNGDMLRDFTYIDDIVEGVVRVLDSPPKSNTSWSGFEPKPNSSVAPYKIYNIGNNNPVKLIDFISAIERKLGITAKKQYLPIQLGDVPNTYADVSDLQNDLGYKPSTSIDYGISKFVDWYMDFHNK